MLQALRYTKRYGLLRLMKSLIFTVINLVLFLSLFSKGNYVDGPTFIVYGGLALLFNFIILLLGMLVEYLNKKLFHNYILNYIVFSIVVFISNELLWYGLYNEFVLFGLLDNLNNSEFENHTKLQISSAGVVAIGLTGVVWLLIKKSDARSCFK
jgi:hypothetical protein